MSGIMINLAVSFFEKNFFQALIKRYDMLSTVILSEVITKCDGTVTSPKNFAKKIMDILIISQLSNL